MTKIDDPHRIELHHADGSTSPLLIVEADPRDENRPAVLVLPGIAVGARYYLPLARALAAETERNVVARAGYRVLENKYYFDRLYTDVIAGGFKGPIARGVYWINQNVVDGVVNGAGRASTVVGRFIDQQVVDGAVNSSATAANNFGQAFRLLTSGKVQQYGALLFGAAAVFAGAIILFV